MNAAAFVCGLGLALAFPRASFAPLAWLAPVPWLARLTATTPARGFRSGFLFGLGFFGLLLNWVHDVLTHYTSLPLFLTVPIWLLLVGYLALYPAVFGGALAALSRRIGLAALAAAPVLWVGTETVRGIVLGGFPWGSVGYARSGGLPLLQAASVGGIALVSLLIAAAWSGLATWSLALAPAGSTSGLPRPGSRALALATLALAGVAVSITAGALRLRSHPQLGRGELLDLPRDASGSQTEILEFPVGPRGGWPPESPPSSGPGAGSRQPGVALRPGRGGSGQGPEAGAGSENSLVLALVQGGFGGELDYAEGRKALSTYFDLSVRAGAHAPSLIVWPESNAPFQPVETPGYLDTLRALSRNTDAVLLLGAVGGDAQRGLTNSAFVIDPEAPPRRYDKRKLVPYGEFVPFQHLFPFIRHFVGEVGEFVPGKEVGVFALAGRRIGVSICYEMIFPREILSQARGGADLIVNLTNDSWYRRGGPWQHADFSMVRAVETGLFTARAASSGRTLLLDPYGRTLAAGPLGGAAILLGEIPHRPEDGRPTCFVRWGDWVGIACATLSAAALAFLVVGNIIDNWQPGPRVGFPRKDDPGR